MPQLCNKCTKNSGIYYDSSRNCSAKVTGTWNQEASFHCTAIQITTVRCNLQILSPES
ncbi:unnamed protein product [Absidia cylindrospora]